MQQLKIARENAVRKRLSALWNVERYRLDVEVVPNGVAVRIDGQEPTGEQMKLFEADIAKVTSDAKRKMN